LALTAKVELKSIPEEAKMTDPSVGMKSFQQELRRGGITIQTAKTDPNLFVHLDAPNGPPEYRFTYVRLKGKTVTAMVIFSAEPPEDGKPYFTVGYAVSKRFQKQGRAKEILVAAIADMHAGLVRNGIPEFYVEAIVGADNMASRKIAEQVISNEPQTVTETLSGLPAFKYVRRITS
jgi:RimJ/RimL family protein N-acetyltransferase